MAETQESQLALVVNAKKLIASMREGDEAEAARRPRLGAVEETPVEESRIASAQRCGVGLLGVEKAHAFRPQDDDT